MTIKQIQLTAVIQVYIGDKLIVDRTEVTTNMSKAGRDVNNAVVAKLKQWTDDQKAMSDTEG